MYGMYNTLLVNPTAYFQETVWIDLIFDDNTDISLKKVDDTCNNLIIKPTIFFEKRPELSEPLTTLLR